MQKIISAGNLSWYLLFPFLLSIFCFFQGLFSILLKNSIDNKIYFIIITNSTHLISLLFSGLLTLISKCLTSTQIRKNKPQNSIKTILHCIICSVIFIVSFAINSYNKINDYTIDDYLSPLEKIL